MVEHGFNEIKEFKEFSDYFSLSPFHLHDVGIKKDTRDFERRGHTVGARRLTPPT